MEESIIEVLLIEDNPGDVRLIKETLKETGLNEKMHITIDGEEGVEYLRQCVKNDLSLPKLILLDLNLPKVNGIEVLKEIKSDPELKHIPVNILTSSESHSDILQCYEYGANCFIVKPIDFKTLQNFMKSVQHFWFNVVKLPDKKTGNTLKLQ